MFTFDPTDQLFHRVVDGGPGNDSLFGFVDPLHPRTSTFTPAGERFDQDEVFHGFIGNDRIFGADGHDVIYGGVGKDIINGGLGVDRLFGGPGNDFLTDPDPGTVMDGGGGDDIMRVFMTGSGPGQFMSSSVKGGLGADQFRVRADGLGAIDDAHFGPANSVAIQDFHREQGDKILLRDQQHPQSLFDLLDANHDHVLNAVDGSTTLGRASLIGAGENGDTGEVTIGDLHLRLGQTEIVIANTDHLMATDFML